MSWQRKDETEETFLDGCKQEEMVRDSQWITRSGSAANQVVTRRGEEDDEEEEVVLCHSPPREVKLHLGFNVSH